MALKRVNTISNQITVNTDASGNYGFELEMPQNFTTLVTASLYPLSMDPAIAVILTRIDVYPNTLHHSLWTGARTVRFAGGANIVSGTFEAYIEMLLSDGLEDGGIQYAAYDGAVYQ